MKVAQFTTFFAILIVAGYILFRPSDDSNEGRQDEATVELPPQITVTVDSPEVKAAIAEREQVATSSQFSEGLGDGFPPTRVESHFTTIVNQLTQLGWSSRMNLFEQDFLPQITVENWKEAYAAITQFPPGRQGAKALRKCRPDTLYVIGETVGGEAAVYIHSLNRYGDLEACLKGWILSNPREALGWIESELEPSYRARIWNLHGTGLLLESSEKWLAKSMANKFFVKLIERHGVELAEQVFQRMAEDLATEEELGMAYLDEFEIRLMEAKMADKEEETTDDPQALALLHACHGIALPASATQIQNSGDATLEKPDKGLVTLLEVDIKDLQEFFGALVILEQVDRLKKTGDPTINGWNVWPTTAKTFVPGNPEYAKLKKTWTGVATPQVMVSCESPVGDWLHVEVWSLSSDKCLLKLYTDWN